MTEHHEIFQVSTLAALVEGVFDGDTRYSEVMEHGDFGVGTFNALDGEMAAVDGEFYHLRADGTVCRVDPHDVTPFAAVTFFRGDAKSKVVTPQTREQLLARVDASMPTDNLFYAIRIDGHFASVVTRTVARQQEPYPHLADAAGGQVENAFGPIDGTIVGFRAPNYVQGITQAGYHLHFVSEDRTCGGHVLDFEILSASASIDQDTELHLEMPTSSQFLKAHMESASAVAEQIEQAENVSHKS